MTGSQADHPALTDQPGSRDLAAVFHDPAQQTIRRLRRQDDQPARCTNCVAVVHQGLDRRRCYQHVGQLVVGVELQLKALARSHRHRAAHLRHYHALVHHLGRQ